jgi:hypothetical protein
MKAIHWITAAAALVCAEPVQAGINDPEVIIYRFPGVHDDGGAPNFGTATVFLCTNFSGAQENMRFVTRTGNVTLFSNITASLNHLQTIVVSTHPAFPYVETLNMNDVSTGPFTGTTAIAATSTNIVCTAMTIDAGLGRPTGVALRGIRFSPVPGSQE